MSTTVMAAVWPLAIPATAKAVLVSLADQANDDGACWPSVGTLCARTCLSERAVRNALRWLEGETLLETDRRNKHDGSMSSNLYTVRLSACRARVATQGASAKATGCGAAPHSSGGAGVDKGPAASTSERFWGARGAGGVGHVVPGGGALGAGGWGTTCPLTIIEPSGESNNPPTPLQGARGAALIGLNGMLSACKAAGEKAIPADDPVWEYAEKVGIGRDILALHWAQFKARRSDGNKRQRGVDGWRQAFRNSVRDNWYRLWIIRPGEVAQLTTVGLQARAEHDAAVAVAVAEAERQRKLVYGVDPLDSDGAAGAAGKPAKKGQAHSEVALRDGKAHKFDGEQSAEDHQACRE